MQAAITGMIETYVWNTPTFYFVDFEDEGLEELRAAADRFNEMWFYAPLGKWLTVKRECRQYCFDSSFHVKPGDKIRLIKRGNAATHSQIEVWRKF